jgi:Acetyltransferase (GNAT) domain
MFPPRRDKFISKWINQKGSTTIGYLSGSKEESLAGHRAVRPSVTGFKIGPLTLCRRRADCTAIVVKLVGHDIIEKNNNNSENPVLFIDISEPNQQALDLARGNGMKKISETTCMYNKAIPSLPAAGQDYGVSILEIA